jgi:hypothetical protein
MFLYRTTGDNGMAFCDWCQCQFTPIREGNRFCCQGCHDSYHIDERRRALAAWRAQQRGSLFLTPMHAEVEEIDEDNPLRRTG